MGTPTDRARTPGVLSYANVIELRDVPRVDDASVARRIPELAVLSSLAHPELEIAQVALAAIQALPDHPRGLYWDVVVGAMSERVRKILEARMKGYQYQTDFARGYFEKGREEGREEGRAEERRNMVIDLVRAKLNAVDPSVELRIRQLDSARLSDLFQSLVSARDEAEARETIDRLASDSDSQA